MTVVNMTVKGSFIFWWIFHNQSDKTTKRLSKWNIPER